MLRYQKKSKQRLTQASALFAVITIAGMAAGSAQAQGLNLGGIKVDLGSSDGGLRAGVSVGSNVSVGATVGGGSVASVDANVADKVSADATVGGGSVASVDANVGNSISASADVGGSSLVDADVSVGSGGSGGGGGGGGGGGDNGGGGNNGGGSNDGGNTGGGNDGGGGDDAGTDTGTDTADNSGGSGSVGGGSLPIADLNVMTMARDATPSICGPAGNFNAINGVSVFGQDGSRLGSVVGAYTENNNLVRVRVMVDPTLVQNSGCVEYSTNNGQVRPDGIVLMTSSALLVAALGR
ncbi:MULTISPECIES: hypothetical protein [unclassified Yoonia]|uniref:hypothetical protein n=1 Tax=unclassified Yoonia TaxID=2629118 RepID=UPI002AFEB6F4|nr:MULTISPECIES: hypothetical protein [unclassified Yoonia]